MEASLIITEIEKDADGYPVEHDKKIPIYVIREKSATRTEVYAAMNAGVDVKMILEIRAEDYELSVGKDGNGKRTYARKIEYDGAIYDIVRAFKNSKALIELTVS